MSAATKLNPVRAQAILVHTVEQERLMAETWPEKWGFLREFQPILEKEAARKGRSLVEFKELSKEVSKGEEEFKIGSAGRASSHAKGQNASSHAKGQNASSHAKGQNASSHAKGQNASSHAKVSLPSSDGMLLKLHLPYPTTSSGMVGRRAPLGPSLERFGRMVRSARDVPLNAPTPAPSSGHLYNPFKQTFVYTGVHLADPVTYQLKPLLPTVPPNLADEPLQYHLDRSQFNDNFLQP